MDNWERVILDDIANVKLSNVDKKTKDNEKSIKLCNYTDVYNNSFINSDKAKNFMIASCNDNEYEKFLLKEGQVAITKDSETPDDIGIPTYINESFDDVVLGYHLSLLTPDKEKLNGKFLNYWFYTKQIKRYFENNAGGSGQRCSLNLDVIKSIPLFLPKLDIQEKIANVLFNIDKKIELNNKINQELEIIAKTLYDYWFVQFDFPNKEGKPYKSSGGEMVYNKELKRKIPKEWEVVYLDDVLEFEKGIEPGSSNYKETPTNKNDIPFFKVADMNGKAKTYIDKNLVQNALVKEDDILVSFDGTVGKIAIGLNGSYSSGIRKIYQKEKLFFPKSFIYEVFKSEEIQQTIKKYATGSNILHAGSSIKNLKIAYNEKLVKQYDLIVKSIFKKLIINIQQNKELSNLRDWLLPMLMNGQVKVK